MDSWKHKYVMISTVATDEQKAEAKGALHPLPTAGEKQSAPAAAMPAPKATEEQPAVEAPPTAVRSFGAAATETAPEGEAAPKKKPARRKSTKTFNAAANADASDEGKKPATRKRKSTTRHKAAG